MLLFTYFVLFWFGRIFFVFMFMTVTLIETFVYDLKSLFSVLPCIFSYVKTSKTEENLRWWRAFWTQPLKFGSRAGYARLVVPVKALIGTM